MASGTAVRLYDEGYRILLTEIPRPLAVRRLVSFSEAVYENRTEIAGVEAVRIDSEDLRDRIWEEGAIPLLVLPGGELPGGWRPNALVDGRILKKNHHLHRDLAPVVIGLGPGFAPPIDCHCAVETNRGPSLGALLLDRPPEENTGLPGVIAGYSAERVLRAGAAGEVVTSCTIGDLVRPDQEIARVGGVPVRTTIGGIVRGLIRPGTVVPEGLKIGDVDPRPDVDVHALSDKALAVADGVHRGLLRFNVAP